MALSIREEGSIFQFEKDADAYGVTPVENLFIAEYMLKAPGDFVKVYLYGLHLCYHPQPGASLETMSKDMDMRPEEILDAYRYWERQGLVTRLSDRPPTFSYSNVKANLLHATTPEYEKDVYASRAFHQSLQTIFGARLLNSTEYQTFADIEETLGLPQNVILLLAKSMVDQYGPRVTFKAINAAAAQWAAEGIKTEEGARDKIQRTSGAALGAQAVLRQFNLSRKPTIDEIGLYAKWTAQWGMSHDAVLLACQEATKISHPNFAYIDKVLQNRRQQGLFTAKAAKEQAAMEEEIRPLLQNTLRALGDIRAATPQAMEAYQGWIEKGFSPETILTAAEVCSTTRRHAFLDLEKCMARLLEKNAFTPERAKEELEKGNGTSGNVFGKAVAAQQYAGQRSYTDEQWQEMLRDDEDDKP